MYSSLRPHGLQPTRLLRPWDFPGRVLEWGAIAFSGQTSTLLAHLPWKHQHPPTQLRATVNAKPAGTVKAGNSPQLLSPSLSCTLMKFSIQKGSQTQRLVNESQWPWSEQFNWHAASRRRGSRSTGVRAGGGPPSGAHEDGMGPPDPCLW